MIDRLGLTPRYADATRFNGLIHAVEVPASESGDVHAQTSSLLQTLEHTLVSAGSGKDRLLMATVYLTNLADYDEFNRVWDAWLPPGCAPARACIQVAALARPGWRVELAVVAAAYEQA